MGCNSRQLKSRIEQNIKERWNSRPRYPTGSVGYGQKPEGYLARAIASFI